jgi:hypothetical protein
MVGETGFEPATLWSQTRCATRLRYSPTHNHSALSRRVAKRPAGGGFPVGPAGFEPAT